MIKTDLRKILTQLITGWENELVEFKEANKDYNTDKIGEYFSALSNEANLRNIAQSWLIFGVQDKTRSIVGTNYRPDQTRLNELKNQIKQSTEPSISFREIHTLDHEDGRVILFEIPAAPRGIPIAWKGHYYARAGDSLTPLGLDKLDEIRSQTIAQDWTAHIVADATIDDLDPLAVEKAKENFAQKHANRIPSSDVINWPIKTFLDRAHITQDGKITRTALLLLGRATSSWRLSPHPAQITWKLDTQERAYEHFGPPFLLNTSALYQKIRNIPLRILPQDELIPIEISKYDQKIIMEALHNCIAHQDYQRFGRIIVTENHNTLIFENEGNFFEGLPEDYQGGHKTPRRYRNPFLVQAMTELNMIDTMGYGIHDMHNRQAKRYLPMPDYELFDTPTVRLTIHGGVVDPAYTRLLIQSTDLPLSDILALDRIQKKLTIPDEIAARLRRHGLIEGRKPNLRVSAQIARATSSQAIYIKNLPLNDEFYIKLISEYLERFGEATRSDIDSLLYEKLSDAMNTQQKSQKIGNLLTKMRRNGKLVNTGTRAKPLWRLAERTQKEN